MLRKRKRGELQEPKEIPIQDLFTHSIRLNDSNDEVPNLNFHALTLPTHASEGNLNAHLQPSYAFWERILTDPLWGPTINHLMIGLARPTTRFVDRQRIFTPNNGNVPIPLILPSATNGAFYSWMTALRQVNPNHIPAEVIRAALQDLQRLRFDEISLILHGGIIAPALQQINNLDASRFIFAAPTSFQRLQSQLAVPNFITQNMSQRHIFLRSIPPIIAQIPIYSFLLRIDNPDAIPGNLDNLYLERWHDTNFLLPRYLNEAITPLYGASGFVIVDYIHLDETLTFNYIKRSWGGQVTFGPDTIYEIFLQISVHIRERNEKYTMDKDFDDQDCEASVWFANWHFYPVSVGNQVFTDNDVTHICRNAFAIFPLDISLRYGKRKVLTGAGYCLAEAYFWLLRDKALPNSKSQLQTIIREFTLWLSDLGSKEETVEEYNLWQKGDFNHFAKKVNELGHILQIIDLEGYTICTGDLRITIPDIANFKVYFAQHLKQDQPIFAYRAQHIFEIEFEDLVKLFVTHSPSGWQLEPIKPRNCLPPQQEDDKENLAAFFDIESYNSDEGVQVPFILCFLDEKGEMHRFVKESESDNIIQRFRLFLFSRYVFPKMQGKHMPPISVVTHNGCKYDYVFLLSKEILQGGKFYGTPDNFKGFDWGCLHFIDFYKFFHAKLDDLGKAWLNEKKLDHPDFALVTSTTWQNYKGIFLPYCEQDVWILSKLWSKFLAMIPEVCQEEDGKVYRCSNKKLLTTSHLAMRMFKTVFNTTAIYPLTESQHKKCLSAYYGGYVANISENPTFPVQGDYVDFNSSYPAAMMGLQPIRVLREITFDAVDYMQVETLYPKQNKDYIRMYRIVSWDVVGFRSYWHIAQRSKDGGLFYTRHYNRQGDKEEWRWECEFEWFAQQGYVTMVVDGYMEFEGACIFEDYITFFYAKKREAKERGDSAWEETYKAFLNHLYGKFGQSAWDNTIYGSVYQIFHALKARGMTTSIRSIKRLFDDQILVTFRDKLPIISEGVHVNIAGYVTAKARNNLMQVAYQCPRLLYADTDSLIVEGECPEIFCDNKKLGYMKRECKILEGRFLAPKMYWFRADRRMTKDPTIPDDEACIVMKAKGIPKKFLTLDMYKQSTRDSKKPYEFKIEMPMFKRCGAAIAVSQELKIIRLVNQRRIWLDEDHNYSDLLETMEQGLQLVEHNKREVVKIMGEKKFRIEELNHVIGLRRFGQQPVVDFQSVEYVDQTMKQLQALDKWLEENRLKRNDSAETYTEILNNFNIDPNIINKLLNGI